MKKSGETLQDIDTDEEEKLNDKKLKEKSQGYFEEQEEIKKT